MVVLFSFCIRLKFFHKKNIKEYRERAHVGRDELLSAHNWRKVLDPEIDGERGTGVPGQVGSVCAVVSITPASDSVLCGRSPADNVVIDVVTVAQVVGVQWGRGCRKKDFF